MPGAGSEKAAGSFWSLGEAAEAVDAAGPLAEGTGPIDVDESTEQRGELSAAHISATSAPAVSSTGK